jgi:hypothetical protein
MTTGYSGTPQLKKLGIKPGTRLAVVDPPEGWAFEEQPVDAVTVTRGAADVIIAFVRTAAEVAPVVASQRDRIRPAGALWIAWPRRAAGHVSDIGDSVVRESGLRGGLVDVKVAALDHDWSALKFVWRVSDR